MTAFTPAAYQPLREFDPNPGIQDALPFELTPQERDLAKLHTLQLERRRRELNAKDTAQAAADAMAREVQS